MNFQKNLKIFLIFKKIANKKIMILMLWSNNFIKKIIQVNVNMINFKMISVFYKIVNQTH